MKIVRCTLTVTDEGGYLSVATEIPEESEDSLPAAMVSYAQEQLDDLLKKVGALPLSDNGTVQ